MAISQQDNRELDIDRDSFKWIPAFILIRKGEKASCPKCGSGDIETEQQNWDGVGYVRITCNTCNKTVCFSRVKFDAILMEENSVL